MTKSESKVNNQEHKNTSPSLIPAFLRMPWWVSVLLAITSYYCFKYLIPQLQFTNQTLQNIAMAVPGLAPIAAIVFLLLAAFRLYDTDNNELNKNTDEEDTTRIN